MRRRDILAHGLAAGMLGGLATRSEARPTRPAAGRGAGGTVGGVTARDGTRLFVRDWGAGPPVLFLHSWALESAMWRQQFAALGGQGVRCIAFDRRGHGRSDVPGTGYDLDTLADDVATVIERLGLREVTLVGHSMGGSEVVRYLGRHGTARVRSVVLVAPTTPFLTRTTDNPYGAPPAYFEQLRATWAADFPRWVEENKRPFFTADTAPATMDWLARMMADADLPAAIACSAAYVATDLRPDLARIDRPVRVIHGNKDVSAPLEMTGRRTAAGIAGARLIVYEGAPHGLFVTHAARLNADILAAVRG